MKSSTSVPAARLSIFWTMTGILLSRTLLMMEEQAKILFEPFNLQFIDLFF